jgi:hypothetical protein
MMITDDGCGPSLAIPMKGVGSNTFPRMTKLDGLQYLNSQYLNSLYTLA